MEALDMYPQKTVQGEADFLYCDLMPFPSSFLQRRADGRPIVGL